MKLKFHIRKQWLSGEFFDRWLLRIFSFDILGCRTPFYQNFTQEIKHTHNKIIEVRLILFNVYFSLDVFYGRKESNQEVLEKLKKKEETRVYSKKFTDSGRMYQMGGEEESPEDHQRENEAKMSYTWL